MLDTRINIGFKTSGLNGSDTVQVARKSIQRLVREI
jgi:hypothetical protein